MFVTSLTDMARSKRLYFVAVPCFLHGTDAHNMLIIWECENDGYALLGHLTRFVNKSGKSSIFRNLRSLVTIDQGVLSLAAFFVEIRRLKELIESGGVVVDRALLIIVAIYGLGSRYQTIRDESITTTGAARFNDITLTELYYECEATDEAADNLDLQALDLHAAPIIAAGNVAPVEGEDHGYAVLTRAQSDIIVGLHNADNTFCPVTCQHHAHGHQIMPLPSTMPRLMDLLTGY